MAQYEPIDNKNLIQAGETLLYRPVFEEWNNQKAGSAKPSATEDSTPVDPGDVESSSWTAASLGVLDGTEVAFTAGVLLLAFQNGANGQTFFYVVPRLGGGAGSDSRHTVERLKSLFQAIGTVLFSQRLATSTFEPVAVSRPFSANQIDCAAVDCAGWDVSTGAPGQNWAFEKLTLRDHSMLYGSVVFRNYYLWVFPGGSAHLAGGVMVRVW